MGAQNGAGRLAGLAGWPGWLAGWLIGWLAWLARWLAWVAGWLGWPAGLAKTSKEKVHEGQGNGEANWVGPDCWPKAINR